MSVDHPSRDLTVIMHRLPLAEVYRPFDALAATKVPLRLGGNPAHVPAEPGVTRMPRVTSSRATRKAPGPGDLPEPGVRAVKVSGR